MPDICQLLCGWKVESCVPLNTDVHVLCTVVSEPSVFSTEESQVVLSAEQIAKDYVIFHRVLQRYPCFKKSRMFGPDINPMGYLPEGQKMMQAYAL